MLYKGAVADYPSWIYYPSRNPPPAWVAPFLSAVWSAQDLIDSRRVADLTSNKVLASLQQGLGRLGYTVETSSAKEMVIRRPVLFGEQGAERVAYHVDAVHDGEGVVVEIEAGRGARGNAVYRDLVRSSLIVNARYPALGVMLTYRHKSGGKQVVVRSYAETRDLLDAIYASGRLQLPFDGVLLFGY